jgi:hypothetical protein
MAAVPSGPTTAFTARSRLDVGGVRETAPIPAMLVGRQ